MIKVNIYNFAKQFQKEYNFLYDNGDRVAGTDEAVEAFDKFGKDWSIRLDWSD